MDLLTIFALILFVVTYVLMFTFQGVRPYIAIVSAVIFVIVGSAGIFPAFQYTLMDALGEIDWNVIMMIAGTMGTVYLFIDSKMPQLLSDIIISKVHSVKWMIFAMSLFAGIVSAFVDNVATVLMLAPVALAVCKKLNISPVPAIICMSISSNLQGAATLVGDTTSILLAKAADLDFMSFFFVDGKPGMFWVTEAGALVASLIILWMFRKENEAVDFEGRTVVEDKVPTVLLCLTVISLIVASFIPYKSNAAPGQFYKPDITNGLLCIFFFVVGLIYEVVRRKDVDVVKGALKEIDYYTIALLMGLFVVIGGISNAGIIDLIGNALAGLSGNGSRLSIFFIYTVVVWMSVLFSAFIDNIPYTATMLPVVAVITEKISTTSGMDVSPNLLYFGLLVGATLGGNLTPIGASANIAGIGILRREGYKVESGTFMRFSIPVTLAAVTTGYLLLWVIWM
ncbi:MAG: arsenic transporter [Clostridiales bacterium]|nr:arsenic transporter [Clostridiales bacterium]